MIDREQYDSIASMLTYDLNVDCDVCLIHVLQTNK
jgi:hypothetical protein